MAREGLEAGLHPRLAHGRLAAAGDLRVQLPASATGTRPRRRSRPPSRRHTGGTFLYWQTCRAQLALGARRPESAEEALASLAEAAGELHRAAVHGRRTACCAPSWHAAAATSTPRVRRSTTRSTGSSTAPRTSVRIAALAAAGIRIEGDAGEPRATAATTEAAGGSRARAPTPCSSAPAWRRETGWVGGGGAAGDGGGGVRARDGGELPHGSVGTRRPNAWEELPRPYPVGVCALARGGGADGGARPRGRGRRGLGGARRARAGSGARGSSRRSSRSPPARACNLGDDGRARRARGLAGASPTTRSASPPASATCSRWWRPARPTGRSASASTWPRRRPACTCRASSRS